MNLLYRSLEWAAGTPSTDPDLVLASLAAALAADPKGLSLVRPPVSSRRSTLYFVGNAGSSSPRWVVKQTRPATAVDTVATLPVATELAALSLLQSWHGDGPRVARPVGLLTDIDALALEFVPGRPLRELVVADPRHPQPDTLEALRAAGEYLRRTHVAGEADEKEVDLAEVADAVLGRASSALSAVGLSLPATVVDALRGVPSRAVVTRRTLLYGDFVPANLIVTPAKNIVGIDPVLQVVGLPEDDVARFLAVVVSDTCFMPGIVLPSVRRTSRDLQEAFLTGWSGRAVPATLLDLRLLQALALRWLRRRELTRMREAPARARRLLVDAFMERVIVDSARRLASRAGLG